MMKNLGNGVLRLGGNSSDKISWTGMPRIDYMRKDSLTTTDVDTFQICRFNWMEGYLGTESGRE